MKKTTLLLALLMVTFSCKNEKKAEEKVDQPEAPKEKQYELVKKFDARDMLIWTKTRIGCEQTTEVQFSELPYKLSRETQTESSFQSTNLIPVTYANNYKVSVIAKKGSSSFFGLRISGAYPDRVDAVFDLEKGEVKGVKKGQDFENEDASIEALGDGWYKCSVSANVSADNIRILFGPTAAEKEILGWEGKVEQESSVYFIPSSLTFEKEVN
ncbi:MAG: hypothetical protein KDD20_00535 [Mangrovimonas sp.]|nr:hypothetical protein [Mangrovimonas sp.]